MTEIRQTLTRVASQFGTPSYVYFVDDIRHRVRELGQVFGGRFAVSYAAKSNPNIGILAHMSKEIEWLDISSEGELKKAIESGWKSERLSFTGPGKTDQELRTAIECGIGEIVVESTNEAQRLDRLARLIGRSQRILVRIAPSSIPSGFGDYMAGRPSPFGVDEEVLDDALRKILLFDNLDLVGFHIFSGTQCLKSEAIVENYRNFIEIFKRASVFTDVQPQKLIFGSGLGLPYHENNQALRLSDIAKDVNPILDQLKTGSRFRETAFVLETGRYLVGEAGYYLTRIVNKKISRGVEIAICDGGMNHHLAACGHMGMVIPRNYQFIKVDSKCPDGPEQIYQLVGPLCTSLDTLARNIKFDGLEIGDVIAVRYSGAYGMTASPIHFISHDPPREIVVESKDEDLIFTPV